MRPRFFATPAALRAWFEANHASKDELLLGLHKTGSGTPSVTWPESVDEALCFGWIDGVRKGLDGTRYVVRFTPRRRGSTWSARNVARVEQLRRQGRMRPAGERAFAARREDRTATYTYEQRHEARLEPAQERRFRADAAAWAFFCGAAPSYRRAAAFWVASAKKPETREARLARLVADSAAGRKVPPLTPRRGAAAPRATGKPVRKAARKKAKGTAQAARRKAAKRN